MSNIPRIQRIVHGQEPTGHVALISEPNAQNPTYAGQGNPKPVVYVDENGNPYKPVFFSYPVKFPIPAGAPFSGQGQIQIQSDADFVIAQTQYQYLVAGTPVTSPNTRPVPTAIDVQLTDGGSNATLVNAAVPVPALFGDGLLPFILPVAKTLPAASTFQINVTTNGITLDAANASVLTLIFTGEKRYFYTV